MFKKLKIVLLIISVFILTGCNAEAEIIKAEQVELNKDYVAISVGEVAVINAEVFPFNAADQNIVWHSSNEDVATVEDGLIKAKAIGSVIIKAITPDGEFYDACNVDIVSGNSILDEYY